MILYNLLLFIHIFSAILGMGPGFVMIHVVKNAQNMTELRHAYNIRHQLHIFVMIGGTLLLLTGICMGLLNPLLFKEGWFVMSLLLFLVALAFGPLALSPRSKKIKRLLKTEENEEIPELYYTFANELFKYERIENSIFLLVIVLMIVKPF